MATTHLLRFLEAEISWVRGRTSFETVVSTRIINLRIRFKRPSAFPKVLLHTLRDPVHLRTTHLIRAVMVMVMGESHSDVSVGPVDMSSRISMRRIISSLFGCPKSDPWWWLASRCLFSWRCCLLKHTADSTSGISSSCSPYGGAGLGGIGRRGRENSCGEGFIARGRHPFAQWFL